MSMVDILRSLPSRIQSGLLSGLTYYLCSWYPKSAQAKRIGLMYSGVSLAGAFGGLLAYAIEKMNGYDSLTGSDRVRAELSSELGAFLGGLGL